MDGLTGTFFSVSVLGGLLLVGMILRAKVKLFQSLFLPSSIIAGFIGLLLGPYLLNVIPGWIYTDWSKYSGILISIVFATLFLGVVLPKGKVVWNKGGPMLCFGVVMGLGQYVVALLVVILILMPLFHVPAIFACILEIGFSGGHGTAAGMTQLFNDYGFPAGGALGQMSATVGIVFAVIMGIVLINLAIRKGTCANLNMKKGIPLYKKTGLLPEDKIHPIAYATIATESIEPLTFHCTIIAIAVLIGWGLQMLIRSTSPVMKSFPLFPLAMIGGLIVQGTCMKTRVAKYLDKGTFDRIMGWGLDFLVASAIASLRLDLFLKNFLPFSILMLAGMVWLVFMVLVVAPKMFPEYFFERSITEFGMQSGVTAVGLLLLRLVDPKYNTGTAEAFGLKQMVYEPFLGGGLVTATAPIFIMHYGMWETLIICAIVMVVFFMVSVFSGWTKFGRKTSVAEVSC
jgi:glutamate:Na+ symporter, ESS family